MNKYFIFFVLVLLYGCQQSQVTKFDLKYPINMNRKDSVSVYSLFSNDWDSILVTSPYTIPESVKKFKIYNYAAVKDKIDVQHTDDYNCTLFFIKNNIYIGYCVAPRSVIDFSLLPNEVNKQYYFIKKAEAKSVFLRVNKVKY